MDPCLSVIIPCFNGGNYLRQLLDCCVRQTFLDWEVIVVDDGSTDTITTDILSKYSTMDDRIKCFKRDRLPKGGDTCRNIGFERSRGRYIIFFDADDLISDDCFHHRVAFMEENIDCDFASFPAAYFKDGDPLPKWGEPEQVTGIKKGNKDNLYYLLTYQYPFTVWTNIYKREAIKSIKWDEQVMVMQDFDWMVSCEMAELKHKYCGIKSYDYYYRQFSDGHNVCGNFINDNKYNSTLYLFSKILNNLIKRPDSELRIKQFYNYITIQLNRLAINGDYNKVDGFIKVIGQYFCESDIHKLQKFVELVKDKNRGKDSKSITPLHLYFCCFSAYKTKRYLFFFIKNIIKKTLGIEQTIYQ